MIRDAAGRYFASFVVQTTRRAAPEVDSEIGIDLGLTHFAVLSDGTKVPGAEVSAPGGPHAQAVAAGSVPQEPGSQNRKKAVVKVARAHARVADTRRDWQHKLSTAIIRDNCEYGGVLLRAVV